MKQAKDLHTGDAYTEIVSNENIKNGREKELLFTGLIAATRTPDMNIVAFSDAISGIQSMCQIYSPKDN